MNDVVTARAEATGAVTAGVDGTRAETAGERNRRWLTREFARLAQLIAPAPDPAHSEAAASGESSEPDEPPGWTSPLQHLASLFGLSQFERDVLLLVVGIELAPELKNAVRAVRGTDARATFALAFEYLPNAHWDATSPQHPLRFWRLVTPVADASLMDAALAVDERVLHYIAGVDGLDERLHGLAQRIADLGNAVALPPDWLEKLGAASLTDSTRQPLVVIDRRADVLPGSERATIVASLAHLGFESLWVYARDLPSEPREITAVARLLDREAALIDGMVVLSLDALGEPAHEHQWRAASFLTALRGPAVLLGKASRELLTSWPARLIQRLELPAADLTNAWSHRDDALSRAVQRASQQFKVSTAVIESALVGIDEQAPGEEIDAAVWHSLRLAARGGLEAIAERIDSLTSFDDLVLPSQQLEALRDIARQLRHRDRVHNDWGFADRSARGLGLCALFAGESGTGKTLAAEAIANEAGLDLYRIDLATVVSKYIGETEKNLKRVFDAAEASGAVLLFDEADALFGKRSEVKSSHDRYANIEVAYLLQRVECYRGLAILTTNSRTSLDRAFLRRIRVMVQFPFPDEAARAQLWRREIPGAAPLADVDFAALARLQVAGGSIRSIAINAAFKAAERDGTIRQQELLEATRAELAKMERSSTGLASTLGRAS